MSQIEPQYEDYEDYNEFRRDHEKWSLAEEKRMQTYLFLLPELITEEDILKEKAYLKRGRYWEIRDYNISGIEVLIKEESKINWVVEKIWERDVDDHQKMMTYYLVCTYKPVTKSWMMRTFRTVDVYKVNGRDTDSIYAWIHSKYVLNNSYPLWTTYVKGTPRLCGQSIVTGKHLPF